jgi:hypothetical protein
VSLKIACLAGVFSHLFLIFTVSCRDTLVALSQSETVLPSSLNRCLEKSAKLTTGLLGQSLPKHNLLHQGLGAYLDITGIEAGYSFFAPHVAAAYSLVFELHYPDGRIKYETARVKSRAAGLRVDSLLDQIGWVNDATVREGMIKLLMYAVWREHPNVSMIRVTFGTVNFPTAAEFKRGRKESYRILYAYDVTREPNRASTPRQ